MVTAISICVFTVMKTELILSVLRSCSVLKLISTVYLFNNASSEIILDSVFKYKTILLGLFRINQFLQHGEKNLINGFIHRLLILPVGNVDTGAGLPGYSDYYLKMDLYNSIWFLTYKILFS